MFSEFITFITNNLPYILLIIIILLLITLIVFIRLNMNLSKLTKKYETLTCGAEGANLETTLLIYAEEVTQAKEAVKNLAWRVEKLEEFEKIAIKEVGLVRFDAFEDISGQLSFAIAVLNEQKNGLLLSNISSRGEARLYVKPVTAGQSSYPLMPEEKEAIAKASILRANT